MSLLRCSLAVARETRASPASSLLVSACPPMSAANIVARGYADERRNFDHVGGGNHVASYRGDDRLAINDGSAAAEPTVRPLALVWRRQDGTRLMQRLRVEPTPASRTPTERVDLSSHPRRRFCIPVRPATVRAQHRRDKTFAVRAPSRDRPNANAEMSRSRRVVARAGAQVQCLLHARTLALRNVQHHLRTLFPERIPSAYLLACAKLHRAVRHRSRLRGGGSGFSGREVRSAIAPIVFAFFGGKPNKQPAGRKPGRKTKIHTALQ